MYIFNPIFPLQGENGSKPWGKNMKEEEEKGEI
jgi:hypothetical protein